MYFPYPGTCRICFRMVRRPPMRNIVYKESDVGLTIDRIVRNYDFDMPHKHVHEEYEIYYLVDGERYYFIENQIYHVKKGTLVFIDRNQIHKTGQYGDSHHERIAIKGYSNSARKIRNMFSLF